MFPKNINTSKASKIIILMLLAFGYLILTLYPYFFSKINRFDSLGLLSVVDEKSISIQKTVVPNRTADKLGAHLLKGEKLTGEFTASENNFGILLVRFLQLSAKVSDTVEFRIKEKGKENWYYENNYKADQFQPNEYFTFGFSSITNSKNRAYVFEVQSQAGTYKNGIGLSPKKPQVALVYKYTKGDLKNLNTLSFFIFKKAAYAIRNANFLENWQFLIIPQLILFFVFFIKEKKIAVKDIIRFLKTIKKNHKRSSKIVIGIVKSLYPYYALSERKTIIFFKKVVYWITSSKIYLFFVTTSIKKRLAIGLLIFLIALLYRLSATSGDQLGVSSFYAGIGGQSDYDQFIKAATCAVRNFCPAILGQNFLIESTILGVFYEIFGFTGGLKVYLYLMFILSSIVATLPYLILSRKNLITIGGIIGSLFLATSDYLTHMAISLPPDNGSVFIFSMFFIVYLFTLNIGTIRWLLFFGLIGTIDGLNKLLLLINDLAAFMLFVPIFFYDKVRKEGLNASKQFRSLFKKKNIRILFLSLVPLLVFLIIYIAWEYIVQIKFSTHYYLRSLFETGGSGYIQPTSFNESLARGNILEKLYYYAGSTVVMERRIITYADLNAIFLAPIFIGLLFFTFRKSKFFVAKLISVLIFSAATFMTLELFRNNYLDIQNIGMYVYAWPESNYTNVFLFTGIIFLFILNLKYSAIRLLTPILPYYIILIILTKNAPWGRLWAHTIVWSIILLSFLVDWIIINVKQYSNTKIRNILGFLLLILFVSLYVFPKISSMTTQLSSSLISGRNELRYLKWVNEELPKNAVILGGGKSDLVTVAENIKRPIIYNTLWGAALLIKPNEIPGVTPNDFSIIRELKNKDNFKKNKYLILEDDINLWRGRLARVVDSVFSTTSSSILHADDYSIKVYKFNSILNKSIYELKLKEVGNP